MSVRRERQLGWFTRPEYPNLGALPPEADLLADLKAGLCPLCGKGPFIVPLSHVAQKHGIDRRTMRDLAGVIWGESLCDPAHSAAVTERSRNGPAPPQSMKGQPQSESIAARRTKSLVGFARSSQQETFGCGHERSEENTVTSPTTGHHRCRKCIQERGRQWRAANPEKVKERNQKHLEANREERLEYNRRYRKANRERLREYDRQRRAAR